MIGKTTTTKVTFYEQVQHKYYLQATILCSFQFLDMLIIHKLFFPLQHQWAYVTGQERKEDSKPWVTRVTIVSAKLHPLLNRSFCKNPESINGKWRSQNAQVITTSSLSHTSVLPPSSFGRPVASTHHLYYVANLVY